jgi:hypothetical protein
MRIHTTHTRDAALRDLNRINRWLIAGSVILTGVLSDVAANAFPGKSVKHTSASKAGSAHPHHAASSSQTSTGVLRAPEQAPQASTESEASHESTPSTEASQESAPAQESAPESESASAQESAPAQEAAPEPEASAPVVSGGS